MEIWRICHQDLIDGLHSRLGLINRLMARSTVRLVLSLRSLTVRLMEVGLTTRTCLLADRTYSRLGATLGSPKLRLLSLLSLLPHLYLCTLPVA